MIQEYMRKGYLRTACWSKAKYLFEGMPITKLCLSRGRHEKGVNDAPHPWLKLMISGQAHIKLDWDIFRHKVPYKIAMKDFIEIQRRNGFIFKDFVVEKIEIGIDDPDLVANVNKRIKEQRKEFKGFREDTRFYVLYKNAPLAYSSSNDGIDIDLIKKINSIAINELNFKYDILELKEIHTYQKGEFSFDFVLQEKEIIEKIIGKHVNNERWFQLPEIRQLPGKVTPGAHCTYARGQKSTWTFIGAKEIKPINGNWS